MKDTDLNIEFYDLVSEQNSGVDPTHIKTLTKLSTKDLWRLESIIAIELQNRDKTYTADRG